MLMAGSFLRRETREAKRGRRQAYLRRMARLLRVGVGAAGRIDTTIPIGRSDAPR
jgi:hypothetical protein